MHRASSYIKSMPSYNYPSLPVGRAQLPLAHFAELGANFLPRATWLMISGKAGQELM